MTDFFDRLREGEQNHRLIIKMNSRERVLWWIWAVLATGMGLVVLIRKFSN